MADFEQTLKTALAGVTEAFSRADADLHEVVARASGALENATQKELELKLHVVWEDVKGVTYELRLETSGDRSWTVVTSFRVPADGYPIRYGATSGVGSFRESGNINEPPALEGYFSMLLSNTDSPVVASVAFHLRKKRHESNRGADSSTEGI